MDKTCEQCNGKDKLIRVQCHDKFLQCFEGFPLVCSLIYISPVAMIVSMELCRFLLVSVFLCLAIYMYSMCTVWAVQVVVIMYNLLWFNGRSDYVSLPEGQFCQYKLAIGKHMSGKTLNPISPICIIRLLCNSHSDKVRLLYVYCSQKPNELWQALPWNKSDHSVCPDVLVLSQILWRIFGQSYDLLLPLLRGIEQDKFAKCGEPVPL